MFLSQSIKSISAIVASALLFSNPSFANLSYSCEFQSNGKTFDMSVTGSEKELFQKAEAEGIPRSGDTMIVTLDPIAWIFTGEIRAAEAKETSNFDVTPLDSGFMGKIQQADFICSPVHIQPALADMPKIAAPKMKEIYEEISSKELVKRTEDSAEGATETLTRQTLGSRIQSAENIDVKKTGCIRYHTEGQAISTVMCVHPTDDMKNLIVFKLGFNFIWNNSSKQWTPEIWGWDDDGGDPILTAMPAQ